LSLFFSIYGFTFDQPSSSSAMPTISNPFDLYASYTLIKSGISARHGGHHVAQKFTTTTFPFNLASSIILPLYIWSEKFGAFSLLTVCELLGANDNNKISREKITLRFIENLS
jgi:hypothetical protein